jgi:hypothetical protein
MGFFVGCRNGNQYDGHDGTVGYGREKRDPPGRKITPVQGGGGGVGGFLTGP